MRMYRGGDMQSLDPDSSNAIESITTISKIYNVGGRVLAPIAAAASYSHGNFEPFSCLPPGGLHMK